MKTVIGFVPKPFHFSKSTFQTIIPGEKGRFPPVNKMFTSQNRNA